MLIVIHFSVPFFCKICWMFFVFLNYTLSVIVLYIWFSLRQHYELYIYRLQTTLWNLVQTLNSADFSGFFSPRHVDRPMLCQLSSTVASLLHWAPTFVYNTYPWVAWRRASRVSSQCPISYLFNIYLIWISYKSTPIFFKNYNTINKMTVEPKQYTVPQSYQQHQPY